MPDARSRSGPKPWCFFWDLMWDQGGHDERRVICFMKSNGEIHWIGFVGKILTGKPHILTSFIVHI